MFLATILAITLPGLTTVYWTCLILGGGLLLISTLAGAHTHADISTDAPLHTDLDVGVDASVHTDVSGDIGINGVRRELACDEQEVT